MPTHSTALDYVRVEVAFSSDPNTATPAFVDLTSRARLDRGIDITRGRNDEFDTVQAGRCSLTFDNTDGALTPGLASSPYYPDVKPQNRIRVTYRDPAMSGNLLPAEDASFEGGTTGSWAFDTFWGFPVGTLATYEWADWLPAGTKSMLITWPTAAGGCWVKTFFSGLVIGRTYTASAYVYVPTGSPDVKLDEPFGVVQGAATAVKNAWTRITATFVATATSHSTGPYVATATAGNQCWIDGIQIDEGSAPGTFTTDPAPIVHRFDGYVDEWPVEWPTGGETEATSNVTALDLQSRIGRMRTLGSVIAETYALDSPIWHFPLGESSESTSAGDIRGTGSTLEIAQYGTGGELTFGAGTGPGTDGSGAPSFAPVDTSNGLYLQGSTATRPNFATGQTLAATVNTSTVGAAQTVARWSDDWGTALAVGTDSTGRATATFADSWAPANNRTVTSASIYADGRTHHIAATIQNTAGTHTMRLYVDGVERGSAGTWSAGGASTYAFNLLRVGGAYFPRNLFTGTISHVAAFGTALSGATLLEHSAANSDGFAGETSDERIERVWSWLGMPAGLLSLDAGSATMGHIDSTDRNAWTYLQDVATTEGGALFVSADGLLTMHSRARTFGVATSVDLAVDAAVIDPSTRLVHSTADVVNDITVTRSGGAVARVVDSASVAEYGYISDSLTVYSDNDGDAFDRANWSLGLRSTPTTRLPELALDALSEPGTAADVRALDIGSRVQITGMPAQGAATFDLRVQGYTERIGAGGWSVTANTTPYLAGTPLILDDATYGRLDEGNRLAY